jgi:hypothetical protein
MSADHDWGVALVVRKVKVMEVSNNTGSPTTDACRTSLKKQNCAQGTASGRTNKDKEEGEIGPVR